MGHSRAIEFWIELKNYRNFQNLSNVYNARLSYICRMARSEPCHLLYPNPSKSLNKCASFKQRFNQSNFFLTHQLRLEEDLIICRNTLSKINLRCPVLYHTVTAAIRKPGLSRIQIQTFLVYQIVPQISKLGCEKTFNSFVLKKSSLEPYHINVCSHSL